MDYRERITSDPAVMLGKPVIKGTRITVEIVLRKMAEGASAEEVLLMYSHLKMEDLYAVFNYASEVIGNEDVIDPR